LFPADRQYQTIFDNSIKVFEQERNRIYCGDVLYSGVNCLKHLAFLIHKRSTDDGSVILSDTPVMRSIFYMNSQLCLDLELCVAVIDGIHHLYQGATSGLAEIPRSEIKTCLMIRATNYPHPTEGVHWLIKPAQQSFTLPQTTARSVILSNATPIGTSDSGIPLPPLDYDYTGLGKQWQKLLYLGVPPRCSCKGTCLLHSCTNALQRIECDHRCKNRCLNRRLQAESFRGVRICDSNDPCRGKYLTTTVPLSAHQFLGTYKGRICFPTSTYGRQHSRYRFLLTTIKNTRLFIDAKWNEDDLAASLRYINHSCLPTGRFELWNVLGYYRIGYFLNTDLQANEELTADYRMVVHNPSEQVSCVCPVKPAHKFPKLDHTYCQRVLCPTNSDARLIAEETITIASPTKDHQQKQLSPTQDLLQDPTLPTSQSGTSSERPTASGHIPPDVGS
jgi:hypothetical protein